MYATILNEKNTNDKHWKKENIGTDIYLMGTYRYLDLGRDIYLMGTHLYLENQIKDLGRIFGPKTLPHRQRS